MHIVTPSPRSACLEPGAPSPDYIFAISIMLLEHEIRILDILPFGRDGPQSPLKCEARVESLSDSFVYDALSYRWGDPGNTRCILVNYEEISITQSLHAALLRLRYKDEKHSMWIDQLCITQNDLVEKTMQVRLMGEVYRKCHHCLIWLGEIDAGISIADVEAALVMLDWIADRSFPIPACVDSPSTFQKAIKALNSIRDNSWWTRIWTIQEAVLPLKKTLLWGPLCIPWITISICIRKWSRTMPRPALLERIPDTHISGEKEAFVEEISSLFRGFISIEQARKHRQNPTDILLNWNTRKATDRRDKVFGLLGLMSSKVDLHYTLQCDYSTSPAQVYIAFTLDMIMHYKNLLHLFVMSRKPSNGCNHQLPTWVADLSDEVMQVKPSTHYFYEEYLTYRASAGFPLDATALMNQNTVCNFPSQLQLPTVIGLTGMAVETIVATGPRLGSIEQSDPIHIAETLQAWMEMARKYHFTLEDGRRGDDFEEAFFRVLVRGLPGPKIIEDIKRFVKAGPRRGDYNWFWDKCIGNQTFFVMRDGKMGLGNWDIDIGDEVWVVSGGDMPLAVRKMEGGSEDDFLLVCCCYVDGIMNGEVYTDMARRAMVSEMDQRCTIRLH
ncbi:hypothetical protein VTL71DRAFT_94 [Oculimacula yallundae]|uniref:Heterokaryon incompatibility domain-containing protein n=1 Tax=Oculimacula yallundae TaxID=86028 RepID=A0ABR4D014_9HELO